MRIKQTRVTPQDGTVLVDVGSFIEMEYQKMNFPPFTTQFNGLSAGNAVNQFATTKYSQNITTPNGQVVGLVSGGDCSVQYLRSIDGSPTFSGGQIQQQQHQQNNTSTNMTTDQNSVQQLAPQLPQPAQALISLPITVTGAKPGDAQQTVHIQLINPNPIPQQQSTKFQMGQMQIPIQGFQPGSTTVLTVAYSPQDDKFLSNGFPEGMTVVAALQPQDLQFLAQAQMAQAQVEAQQNVVNTATSTLNSTVTSTQLNQNITEPQHQQQQNNSLDENEDQKLKNSNGELIAIKQEPDWENTLNLNGGSEMSVYEYISQVSQSLPLSLQPYLKFNPNNLKYEENNAVTDNTENNTVDTNTTSNVNVNSTSVNVGAVDNNEKPKRRRKTVKKPPKPKPPKPGQVLIATAIDGTVLFCCPECQMAYPEKENLEQHLTVHKIERRHICDICGAGLKRKEHLERHKSGHNPDRPYICSVCMKGFKRKEHLNLHFVIHSGEKNEICGECGKGFYRKDHLRKHIKSHLAKRLKQEMNARIKMEAMNANSTDDGGGGSNGNTNGNNGIENTKSDTNLTLPSNITIIPQQSLISDQNQQEQINSNNGSDNVLNPAQTQNLQPHTQPAISLSTVYVPTSDNTTLPVQIQIPQIVTTTSADGTTTNTIVMPTNQTTNQQNTGGTGLEAQQTLQMMTTQ